MQCSKKLFDDLVDNGEQPIRNIQAKRLSSPEVDDHRLAGTVAN